MTERKQGEGHLSDMARRIAALSPEKRALLEARLGTRNVAGVAQAEGLSKNAPLSFAQERIYRLARADPESAFFVSTTRLPLPRSTSLQTLRAALALVLERHEALRSELTGEPDELALLVRATSQEPLIVADSRDGRSAERLVAEAVLGVRSLTPPLTRAVVSTTADGGLELCLVTHALVCDGPSLTVTQHELLAACEAMGRGGQPDLPPVQMRPADHAREQRRRLQGARVERLVDRWRALEHDPGCLALHTDRPRVPNRLPQVARCGWPFSSELLRGLLATAQTFDLSVSALLSAVAAGVLGRFARQSSLVLGVQVLNRTRRELQGFVGVVANTLPLTVDLGTDPGIRTLAMNANAELKAALADEELPYERLVQALRLQRSDRYNPLFQVVLAVRSELQAGLMASSPNGWFRGGSIPFDLAIAVDDVSPSPGLELLYNAHLFEEEAVRTLARSLEMFLGAALERPEEPVSRLPLLAPTEREGVEPTHIAPPTFADTIHGLFERRAALDPDRIAIEGDETISYAELNARANRLGRALLARGVKPGDTVGVHMPRSADLVVSFLAVLKTGAIYLPLDPQYPAERFAFMVRDSGARLILHRGGTIDDVPRGCEAVDLATLDVSAHPSSNLEPGAGSREAAYLMYTSGSTGRPKGVRVQHLGVCHVADAQLEHFGLTSDERILQFASPSFDASIFEFVMAPRCGGVLHMARVEDLMPGPPLVQLLKARRITVLTIPPSALGVLAPIKLPDLRVVISAGETCGAELVSRWASGRRFFNAYGPTEGSIWATVMECVPDERPPSIGHPLRHVRARVVDELLRPVPVGVPGELLLGGPGVVLGYLNRPELTAERFLEPGTPGALDGRWYRTGDLVRRDSAGRYWHLGRVDRQVKVRGFRIEPGEIEHCILEYPGVQSAAVEVEANNLVAYYVAEAPLDTTALQGSLSRRLPQHMVPTTFVALKAMPLGSNGKLDRAALSQQSRPRASGLRAATTPTEKTLVEIWKSVLRVEEVGIDDNFFHIGGHSLLAASVISRSCAALGREEVPLRVMFRSPTIAQLAAVLDSAEPITEPNTP